MNAIQLVDQIEGMTKIEKKEVRRILRALASVAASELQSNQAVDIPGLGRLIPFDMAVTARRTKRTVLFEPSTQVKKRLAKPLRRLRVVA